jgi:hypothetical protein
MPAIPCPACGTDLTVPEAVLGRPVQCSACRTTFTAGGRPEKRQPLPARRRPRDDDFDDYDDDPARRRPRKPEKVQAIGVMMLVGGILATLHGLAVLVWLGAFGIASLGLGFLCCFWPGPYYGLVLGILAIVRGSALLGEQAYRSPPPRGIAVMQIINIVNGDLPNCVMGIITLAFLGDEATADYFRG